jgi:MOSC domain-containing protein YiiM
MRTIDELEAAWAARAPAPTDAGTVRLLCVRKGDGVHETPDAVEITARDGLRGDRWADREPGRDPDGVAAVTLINAGVVELMRAEGQPLDISGDNILVDLDISVETLPPGSRLAMGGAVLRVSEEPHTGCSKFRDRFGLDALKWVSTPEGKRRRLRGVNCSVLQPGTVRAGDRIDVLLRPAGREPDPTEARALAQ